MDEKEFMIKVGDDGISGQRDDEFSCSGANTLGFPFSFSLT